MSFADAEYSGKRKQTRREVFLTEMEKVLPWAALLGLIEPFYPKAGKGRHPYPMATMLRVHLLQNWFGYSDPAMEEALYEVTALRCFAGLSLTRGRIPDETTIHNFRRMLETHDLAAQLLSVVNADLTQRGLLLRHGTIVDAKIIHAAPSTKNADRSRDPEMHQTRKGNQWYFGMKAHIGVDVESGVVHTVTTTAANASDVTETDKLLHGEKLSIHGDAGYTGADKREELEDCTAQWHNAAKRGTIKAMPEDAVKEATQALETIKAAIRARVEHPFRVIKRQFGYQKARFKGLAKNTAQVLTLFALSNLWMARHTLMAKTGKVRPLIT